MRREKMKSDLNQIHSEIVNIASRDKLEITKTSLTEIPEIQEKDWSTLKANLLRGEIQVREMTASPISFALFAADTDNAGLKLFTFLAMVVPIVAIALAIFGTWWWLALAVLSLLFFRIAKWFYRMVIFQAVVASEKTFCFLKHKGTALDNELNLGETAAGGCSYCQCANVSHPPQLSQPGSCMFRFCANAA
jgi:hypothetical protein